jgi:DNA-binding NtrC family response regulator
MLTIFLILGCFAFVSFVVFLACCKVASRPMPAMDRQQDIVLVIDDDTEMLHLTQVALDSEGYSAHTASNPKEGIEYYKEHWRDVKLVLLDFLMPEMTGDQVAERLREIDPEVQVLMVTGYPDRIPANKLQNGICGLLPKPFRLDELVERVRHALRLHPMHSVPSI